MAGKIFFSDFPETIAAGDKGQHSYIKSPDMFALLGESPPLGEVVGELEKPCATLYRGTPSETAEANHGTGLVPVYRMEGQGDPAIPTGHVLIRLEPERRVADVADALRDLGYHLESSLSYAPQAGWVRATSGQPLDSLRGLPKLRKLPNLAHLEVQMVKTSAKK